MRPVNHTCAGYLLIETVVLGLIVLAAAAVLGIFARTAVLDAESTARADAAFLARERFSVMDAACGLTGTVPGGTAEFERNGVVYTVTADPVPQGMFYDVTLHISWTVWGRMQAADFVRRVRTHDATGGP